MREQIVRRIITVTLLTVLGTGLVLGTYAVFLTADLRSSGRTIIVTVPQRREIESGPAMVAIGDSLSTGYMSEDLSTFYLDASRSIPGLAAKNIGMRLVDLAIPGANCVRPFTTEEHVYRAPAISAVPRIPRNARVVIVNCGTNDTWRKVGSRRDFDAVLNAVHRRAPRARVVIVTLRRIPTASAASTLAWNVNERAVARRFGASVVDLETDDPGVTPEWPDGIHPTLGAATQIAARIATTLRTALDAKPTTQ